MRQEDTGEQLPSGKLPETSLPDFTQLKLRDKLKQLHRNYLTPVEQLALMHALSVREGGAQVPTREQEKQWGLEQLRMRARPPRDPAHDQPALVGVLADPGQLEQLRVTTQAQKEEFYSGRGQVYQEALAGAVRKMGWMGQGIMDPATEQQLLAQAWEAFRGRVLERIEGARPDCTSIYLEENLNLALLKYYFGFAAIPSDMSEELSRRRESSERRLQRVLDNIGAGMLEHQHI